MQLPLREEAGGVSVSRDFPMPLSSLVLTSADCELACSLWRNGLPRKTNPSGESCLGLSWS